MSFQTDAFQPDFIQEFADGPYTAFQPDAFQPNFIQEFAAQPILGWEPVLPHLINLNPRRGAYAGVRSKSGFAAFPQPFPEGWQVQPPQPPFQTTVKQRSAALSQWEDGIEFPFVSVTKITWAFDIQQLPLKINYRSGAWSHKTE